MKKIIFLVAAWLFAFGSTHATNYYFSNSGDDTRTSVQASNPATPWKTIGKLNSFFPSLTPGDCVLFYRGHEFSGTINIQKSGSSGSPIIISAYGPGSSLPAISGWTYPSSWTNTSGGIWQASCPSCGTELNSVLVNNIAYAMGRYPNKDASNKGYLTFESHTGKTVLVDNELSSSPSWTGAEAVVRTRRWVLDRNPITTHSSTSLTFTTDSENDLINGYGYFIQNSLSTLDQFGEWYFEKNATPSLRKMDIYFGAINPNTYNIAASCVDNLLTSDGYNYIEIQNLNFTGANKTALSIKNGHHISVKNCYIRFPGKDGIEANNLTTTTIDNNEFYYVNNTAIYIPSTGKCNYTSITNNLIEYTGTLPGMGQSGNLGYEGIVIYGNNNTLEYNTLDYVGSVGIEFQGSSLLFKNNFINHFTSLKDDGGGIYTWKGISDLTYTNRKITGNIILNGTGAGEGTNNPSYKVAEGIYMDDNSENVEITDNTVANCGNSGIFSHTSHELTIRKNTLYNNSIQLLQVQEHTSGVSHYIRNNSFTSNILVAKEITQLVADMGSDADDIGSFGPSDTNAFCRPLDDKLVIHNQYTSGGNYFESLKDLALWQAAYSRDAASTTSPFTYPAYTATSPGSNKFSNSTFTSNVNNVSVYSSTGTIAKTWINTGGLDAGTAKITYTSGTTNGAISFAIGAIDVTKKYILKFSLKGSANNTMQIYLSQNHSPYDRVSPISNCKVSTSRTENEFLLVPSANDSDVTATFEISPSLGTLYVDNVELYEATVTMNNPDTYLRFEYNATKNNQNVSLGGTTYKDARGSSYTGTITLPPFTSLVLFKQLAPRPTGIVAEQDFINDFIVYPNPVNDQLTISFENSKSRSVAVQILDLTGKLMYSENRTIAAGENTIQHTVSGYSPGMYIIRLVSEDGVSQKKFTKTN